MRVFVFCLLRLMFLLRSGYGHLLEPGWRRLVWDQMARTRIEGGRVVMVLGMWVNFIWSRVIIGEL